MAIRNKPGTDPVKEDNIMKGKKKIIAAIETLKRGGRLDKEINDERIRMLEWVLDNKMSLFKPYTFDPHEHYKISEWQQIIGPKKADK